MDSTIFFNGADFAKRGLIDEKVAKEEKVDTPTTVVAVALLSIALLGVWFGVFAAPRYIWPEVFFSNLPEWAEGLRLSVEIPLSFALTKIIAKKIFGNDCARPCQSN